MVRPVRLMLVLLLAWIPGYVVNAPVVTGQAEALGRHFPTWPMYEARHVRH